MTKLQWDTVWTQWGHSEDKVVVLTKWWFWRIRVFRHGDCIQKKPGELSYCTSWHALSTGAGTGWCWGTRVMGYGGFGRSVVPHRGTGPGTLPPTTPLLVAHYSTAGSPLLHCWSTAGPFLVHFWSISGPFSGSFRPFSGSFRPFSGSFKPLFSENSSFSSLFSENSSFSSLFQVSGHVSDSSFQTPIQS